MPPVISLLSDFGDRYAYVAQVKARLLNLCPACELVDVSHHARDLLTAAWLLHATWRYFPPGSLHLAMVEPGAQAAALVAQYQSHFFIGPDNGVLSFILAEAQVWRAPQTTGNFKARDLYPELAAACIAGHLELESFDGTALRLDIARPQVMAVDAFGNLITNVAAEQIRQGLKVGATVINEVVESYIELEPGQLGLMVGSDATIEIVACGVSAARILNAHVGQQVDF